MIRILDGDPGTGKSYHAVEDMVAKLKAGGHVVTNVPIRWENIKAYCAEPSSSFFGLVTKPGVVLEDAQMTLLTEQQAQDFWQYMPQGTLECPTEGYFDELQNLFNARNWSETQKKHGDVLKFISHHRHYHTNLTLLTQDRGNIDKQFRVMCAEFWEHMDMNGWNLIGIGWPFPQFLRKKYGKDQKQRLKFSLVWKDKKIWTLYDSHNKVGGIELKRSVTRLKLSAAKLTWRQRLTYMFKSWLIIGAVVFGGLWWAWSRFHSPGSGYQLTNHPANLIGGTAIGRSVAGSHGEKEKPSAPSVRAVTESLRYAEGNYYRRTDKGSYTLHHICAKGTVVAIDDEMVTVRPFDGGLLYVMLDGGSSGPGPGPVVTSQPASLPWTPPPSQSIPVVASEPPQETLSQREGNRIHAYLHQPIGGPVGSPSPSPALNPMGNGTMISPPPGSAPVPLGSSSSGGPAQITKR